MSSWSAKVNPRQQSTGYSRTDKQGNRITESIAEVRIDPHPQNGVILRRLAADGRDVHSTRHPDEENATQIAVKKLDVKVRNVG